VRAPVQVRLERLQKLIDRIAFESEKGAVIVVEGQRDQDSLRELGITGRVVCVQSSRRNAIEFAEELRDVQDVIVLTDFDRQGVFLAKRLQRVFNSQKVPADLAIWRELRRLARSDIRSIEELPRYQQRLSNLQDPRRANSSIMYE